jgi:hypothetical protein
MVARVKALTRATDRTGQLSLKGGKNRVASCRLSRDPSPPNNLRKKSEMPKWSGIVLGSILGAFAATPLAADEPTPTVAPAMQLPTEQAPTPVKTGKERLSSKASDDQRVDNCKVPPELRGTAVRSDTCESKTQAIPTN